MDRKKRVVLGVIVLALIMTSVIIVSAGFWDLFKFGKEKEGLEGELPTKAAGAFVNVTGGGQPQIIFVSDVSSKLPTAAGTKDIVFSYIVYHTGTVISLPPNGGLATGRIKGENANEATRANETGNGCLRVAISGYDPNFYANYSCTVKIYWYDGPGGANWKINATVIDRDGVKDENSSRIFQMDFLRQADSNPDYLNWSSVSISGINIIADNNITLNNTGNVALSDLQINATNLTGKQLGQILGSEKFSFDDTFTTMCDTNLTAETFVSSPGGTSLTKAIQSDPSLAVKNLYFCLKSVGVPTDWYNSTRKWVWRETFVA